MNLNETILTILSDSEPMDVTSVDRAAMKLPGYTCVRDVVYALEAMKKSGEVVHSWSHGGSVYRKRTPAQLAEWRAVHTGEQKELL